MVNKRVDLSDAQINHLKGLVTGQVSTNETILDQHGRDESAIPPVRPSAVVMPQSTEEVSKVLAYCNVTVTSITIRMTACFTINAQACGLNQQAVGAKVRCS